MCVFNFGASNAYSASIGGRTLVVLHQIWSSWQLGNYYRILNIVFTNGCKRDTLCGVFLPMAGSSYKIFWVQGDLGSSEVVLRVYISWKDQFG